MNEWHRSATTSFFTPLNEDNLSSAMRRIPSWSGPSNNNTSTSIGINIDESAPFIQSSSIANSSPNGIHRPYSLKRFARKYIGLKSLLFIMFLFILMMYLISSSNASVIPNAFENQIPMSPVKCFDAIYNSTYPLTPPKYVSNGIQYKIGLIADMDKNSREDSTKLEWASYLRLGHLTISEDFTSASLDWSRKDFRIKGNIAEKNRGMELSDLIVYNAKLYTVDDRTGIVYEITEQKQAIPKHILMGGNGSVTKGFKSEWMSIKDNYLYIGGWGKEWTTETGEYISSNPMWVKRISPDGKIEHLDWKENYEKLRAALGISFPGYAIHEAATWSDVFRKWYFMPRRVSKQTYDEVLDNSKGSNLLITANEDFSTISTYEVGEVVPTHGFSSFKFVPGTGDTVIIATKTEECKDGTDFSSFVSVFKLLPGVKKAKMLIDEKSIDSGKKFEGVEFL